MVLTFRLRWKCPANIGQVMEKLDIIGTNLITAATIGFLGPRRLMSHTRSVLFHTNCDLPFGLHLKILMPQVGFWTLNKISTSRLTNVALWKLFVKITSCLSYPKLKLPSSLSKHVCETFGKDGIITIPGKFPLALSYTENLVLISYKWEIFEDPYCLGCHKIIMTWTGDNNQLKASIPVQ